jgi:DNA-directed RNA polymerase III subunit RPC1
MNITQGVPRIEQIINNTQKIKTPIIMAKLTTEDSKEFAQEVASKLEKVIFEFEKR